MPAAFMRSAVVALCARTVLSGRSSSESQGPESLVQMRSLQSRSGLDLGAAMRDSELRALSLLFDKGGPSAMLAATEVISALPKHSSMGTAFSQMLLGQMRATTQRSLDAVAARIDDESKEILANFSVLITDTVVASIYVQRDELNADINQSVAAFQECEQSLAHSQEQDVKQADAYKQQKEQEHSACRTHSCIADVDAKCKHLNDTVAGFKVPCDVPVPAEPGTEMLHFLENLVNWSNSSLQLYRDLSAQCDTARDTCNAVLEGCQNHQLAFENSYCSWMRTTQRVCHSYEECYNAKLHAHNASVALAQGEEANLKLEYDALMRILCLTDVAVNPTNLPVEERTKKTEQCNTKAIDTSGLNITYLPVPPRSECSAHTSPQPGTAEFNKMFYEDHGLEYSNTSFLAADPNFCLYVA